MPCRLAVISLISLLLGPATIISAPPPGSYKIVIDAALDHLSQASAEIRNILSRIKLINRDASGVGALLGIRTVSVV